MKYVHAVLCPVLLALSVIACSGGGGTSSGEPTLDGGGGGGDSGGGGGGPGPAPTQTCTLTADKDGFIALKSAESDYWMRLPVGYATQTPYPLVLGAHGCGDKGYNYGTWALAPYEGRATQGYISISVGGREGQCWDLKTDEKYMLAALAHARSCVYADQRKIFAAGYSSGGRLAYQVALTHADLFSGILVAKTAISDRSLLEKASYKMRVAHHGSKGDSNFPPSSYQADWAALKAAGYPLTTFEDDAGHDGSGVEWGKLTAFATQWSR
jgi:pimeloyl-ACP methyl ester carboxylesterase